MTRFFFVGSKAYLDKLNRRAACIIEGPSIGAEENQHLAGPAYKHAEIGSCCVRLQEIISNASYSIIVFTE